VFFQSLINYIYSGNDDDVIFDTKIFQLVLMGTLFTGDPLVKQWGNFNKPMCFFDAEDNSYKRICWPVQPNRTRPETAPI